MMELEFVGRPTCFRRTVEFVFESANLDYGMSTTKNEIKDIFYILILLLNLDC